MTRFIKTRADKGNKPPIRRKKDHIPDAKEKVCSYHKCKKEATGRYTVDLDIKGLYYCKQHKTDIQAAILWMIIGAEELANASMGFPPISRKVKK